MTDVRDESRNFLRVIMIYGTISLGLIMINRIVMQNNFNLRLLQRSFCFAVLINYFDSGRNVNQKFFFSLRSFGFCSCSCKSCSSLSPAQTLSLVEMSDDVTSLLPVPIKAPGLPQLVCIHNLFK